MYNLGCYLQWFYKDYVRGNFYKKNGLGSLLLIAICDCSNRQDSIDTYVRQMVSIRYVCFVIMMTTDISKAFYSFIEGSAFLDVEKKVLISSLMSSVVVGRKENICSFIFVHLPLSGKLLKTIK